MRPTGHENRGRRPAVTVNGKKITRQSASSISPASFLDSTLLKPTATSVDIRDLCEQAVEWGFASVCIPPIYVPLTAELLYGSDVAVGTVIGFPTGYNSTETKNREAAEAIRQGASEIDMVIHLGTVLEGRLDAVEKEIRDVIAVAGDASVKVIIECCWLTDQLKVDLAERIVRAGAAFVKTSTGFGVGGATAEDVRLLAEAVGGCVGIKAAGGIRDWRSCREMIEAGAARIGTSSAISIMQEWQRENSGAPR